MIRISVPRPMYMSVLSVRLRAGYPVGRGIKRERRLSVPWGHRFRWRRSER